MRTPLANAIDAKVTIPAVIASAWLTRAPDGLELNLPDAELELLEWAGILHDVGKIGIPEVILNKPGRLTREEFEEIRRHPHMSYEVLRPVGRLGPVLSAVLYHHENWDGTGYPHGLRRADPVFGSRCSRHRHFRCPDLYACLPPGIPDPSRAANTG